MKLLPNGRRRPIREPPLNLRIALTRAIVYALNEIDVEAPPEVAWRLLVDAENWSRYFPAEDKVKILTGEPALALGAKCSRVTVGFPMHLIVTECVTGPRALVVMC